MIMDIRNICLINRPNSVYINVRKLYIQASVVGSSGLLLQFLLFQFLFRFRNAANYEELGQRNNASPAYDELNLGK